LEGSWTITQPKAHYQPNVNSPRSSERCFMSIPRGQLDLIESRITISHGVSLVTCYLFQNAADEW
jgi:hypothetical protein